MGSIEESKTGDQRGRSSSWEKKNVKKTVPERDIRIAVVGPSGVGKSALVVRFLTKRFIGDYSGQESTRERMLMMDGSPVCVHVWDTQSSTCPREDYISWADGLILVFSLTDVTSFRHARAYAKQLLHFHNHQYTSSSPGSTPRHFNPTTTFPGITGHRLSPTFKNNKTRAVVLVGNKSDLSQNRQVSLVQARELAATLRCPYVETSASDNLQSVHRAFGTVYEHIKLREHLDTQNNNNSKMSSFYSKSAIRLSGLKQHLKSLTDFRSRTNTF